MKSCVYCVKKYIYLCLRWKKDSRGRSHLCRAAEGTPRGLMGNEVALWLCWLSSAWQLFAFALSDKRRLYSLSVHVFAKYLSLFTFSSCLPVHICTWTHIRLTSVYKRVYFLVVQFSVHAYWAKHLFILKIISKNVSTNSTVACKKIIGNTLKKQWPTRKKKQLCLRPTVAIVIS